MFGHYGETIARLREKKGLTKSTLARLLNIPPGKMTDIEKSASRPPETILSVLCDQLGIGVEEIDASAGFLPSWAQQVLRENPHKFLEAVKGLLASSRRSDTNSKRSIEELVLQTNLGALYHGGCMDMFPSIENESVDLVFADPPFNLDKDYGAEVDDDLAEQKYLEWCFVWLNEVVRILKPGASFFLYNLPKWNVRLGAWLCQYLEFKHWVAVDLKFSLPIPGRLYPSHYSLLYFTKGLRANRFSPPRIPIETCRHCGGELRDYGGYKDRMNPAGVNITDVWTDLSPVRHSRFKRRIANELPLKMLDRILDTASQEGDLVFDPFGGSGTTYVAAELKLRRWLGCEIGDCQPIIDRFKKLNQERALLEEIRNKVNVLFTENALKLRSRNGHDTSKYRLLEGAQSNVPKKLQGTLFD